MDKSVNKSTFGKIGVWQNVENPGVRSAPDRSAECHKNEQNESVFRKGDQANHVFDSEME